MNSTTHIPLRSTPATDQSVLPRRAHRFGSRSDWILIGSMALAYAPMLFIQARNTLRHTHYQFVPAYVACCLALLWWRWPDNRARRAVPLLPGLLLVASIPLLIGGVVLVSPWLVSVSAMLAFGSMLLRLTGREGLRELFAVWAIMWLAIPLPFRLDIKLITSLQYLTSHSASVVLDLMGYNHLMSGNVLEFPGRRMLVSEACSGVQSLFTLMAFTALYVVMFRRPLVAGILLIASSVFWACLLNIARVTIVAVSAASWDFDLSTGRPHELLGYAVYAVALLMLLSTDRLAMLARRLGLEIGGSAVEAVKSISKQVQTSEDEGPGLIERLQDAWSEKLETLSRAASDAVATPRLTPRLIVACVLFVGIAFVQVGAVIAYGREDFARVPAENVFVAETLPPQIGSLTRKDFLTEVRETSSDYGEHSAFWNFESSQFDAIVSVDYPFVSWHNLTGCYRADGWQIEDEEVHLDADGDGFPWVRCLVRKPSGEFGYLIYSQTDGAGKPIAPADDSTSTLMDTVRRRIRKGMASFGVDADVIQFQLFVQSDFPLSEEERARLLTEFRSIREQLRTAWIAKRS